MANLPDSRLANASSRTVLIPFTSDLLLSYYNDPPDYCGSSRDVLDLTLRMLHGDGTQEENWGFEIQEGPNHHRLAIIRVTVVILSLLLGATWSLKSGDIHGGVSIGGLLAIVSTLIVAALETIATGQPPVVSGSTYRSDVV